MDRYPDRNKRNPMNHDWSYAARRVSRPWARADVWGSE